MRLRLKLMDSGIFFCVSCNTILRSSFFSYNGFRTNYYFFAKPIPCVTQGVQPSHIHVVGRSTLRLGLEMDWHVRLKH